VSRYSSIILVFNFFEEIAMPTTDTKSFFALSLAALLASIPHGAMAEGAVRVLDCVVTQSCDASGACKPASEQQSFRMEPVNLLEDGSGSYVMIHGDAKTDMQALSFAGPFYWASDDERNTLLASSETEFLWHRLELSPAPVADIRFMNCVLSQ
jgi:hypothetical protein